MAEQKEWQQAPFVVTLSDEFHWAYKSELPDGGGEISGIVVAESKAEAEAKLAEIYPGATFA